MTTNTTQDNEALGIYSRKTLDGFLDFCYEWDRLHFNINGEPVYTCDFIDGAPRYNPGRFSQSNGLTKRPATLKEWGDLLYAAAVSGGELREGVCLKTMQSYLTDALPVAWRDYLRQKEITPDGAAAFISEVALALSYLCDLTITHKIKSGGRQWTAAGDAFDRGDKNKAAERVKAMREYFVAGYENAATFAADLFLLASIKPQADFVAGACLIDDLRRLAAMQGVKGLRGKPQKKGGAK